MKELKLLFVVVLLLLAGCVGRESAKDVPAENVSAIAPKTSGALVRMFVENNAFIDFDVDAVSYASINPASRAENGVTEEDDAKMQAAIYRFYKHVSVVDSQYVWDLNSGADINVSDNVFNFFVNNFEDINRQIKESNAKGTKVILREPDEKYFESLLK